MRGLVADGGGGRWGRFGKEIRGEMRRRTDTLLSERKKKKKWRWCSPGQMILVGLVPDLCFLCMYHVRVAGWWWWWWWWFTDIPGSRYRSRPIETDETRLSSYLQSVVQTWCCRTGQRVEFVHSWNEHPARIIAVLRWVMCSARGPKSNSAQGPIKPGTGSE